MCTFYQIVYVLSTWRQLSLDGKYVLLTKLLIRIPEHACPLSVLRHEGRRQDVDRKPTEAGSCPNKNKKTQEQDIAVVFYFINKTLNPSKAFGVGTQGMADPFPPKEEYGVNQTKTS